VSFDKIPKPDQLIQIQYAPPKTGWMETPVEFRPGTWSYSGTAKSLTALDLPNPRSWQPSDDDWKLPENWQTIILSGMKERLGNIVPSGFLWTSASGAAPARINAISI